MAGSTIAGKSKTQKLTGLQQRLDETRPLKLFMGKQLDSPKAVAVALKNAEQAFDILDAASKDVSALDRKRQNAADLKLVGTAFLFIEAAFVAFFGSSVAFPTAVLLAAGGLACMGAIAYGEMRERSLAPKVDAKRKVFDVLAAGFIQQASEVISAIEYASEKKPALIPAIEACAKRLVKVKSALYDAWESSDRNAKFKRSEFAEVMFEFRAFVREAEAASGSAGE